METQQLKSGDFDPVREIRRLRAELAEKLQTISQHIVEKDVTECKNSKIVAPQAHDSVISLSDSRPIVDTEEIFNRLGNARRLIRRLQFGASKSAVSHNFSSRSERDVSVSALDELQKGLTFLGGMGILSGLPFWLREVGQSDQIGLPLTLAGGALLCVGLCGRYCLGFARS